MLTGTKVKILIDPILSDPLLTTVNFYDQKSRVIQQLIQNHFGHFDTLNTKYSFIGDVLMSRYTHSGAAAYHVVYDSLVYDHARRLTETYQKLDDQPMIHMSKMTYNELGMLVEKNLHRTGSSSFLQSLDYSYNIRGWLTGINLRNNGNDAQDVFFQDLVYDSTISALNCPANYNGNITASIWHHSGSATGKGYGYFYDELNRIIQSKFGYFSASGWTHNQLYSNPIIEYDKNGNLKRLQRHHPSGSGYSVLDDLYYFYTGNSIAGVNDYVNSYMGFQDNGHYYNLNDPENTREFFYDNNGNLNQELNKGITSIIYNQLNLPYKIELENNRRIYYLYDANGTKLRKYFYEDNRLIETTDYSGIFVYTDDQIDYIQTNEGRLKWDNHDSLFYAEYFIKDHLGNVRDVLTTNPNFSNPLIQATDYYPFGLEIQDISISDNLQFYNSKELQTDAKLWWYDYGARFYDPVLGRWHSVDPLAEKYFDWSPFNYVLNNPIINTDPQGDTVRVYTETSGTGHAWLSVGEGENMTVYSYGRYAGTNEKSTGINTLSDGPGVLVKLEGQDALDYNQEKADNTGSTVFQILDVTDEQVANTINDAFNSSNELPDNGVYKDDNRARVIDNYKVTENNCTTKVADALNESGSKSMKSESVLNGGPNYSKGAERPILPHSLKVNLTIKAQNRQDMVKLQERNKPK